MAALAVLWIAGRVLVLTPLPWAAAVVNVAFPVAAALALAVPFLAARNRRNYFFVALLLLLAAAAATGHPALDKVAIGSVLALLLAYAAEIDGMPLAALASLSALAHVGRLALWQPWKTVRLPLVWALHLAYCWIPVHLVLRALAEVGAVTPSAATHALTAGATGGLIMAMMTRTSRGHTGRALRADGVDVACYLLVAAAAVVRVFLPMVDPTSMMTAVLVSAALWSSSFALFAVRYGPMLVSARIDGRPG